MKRNSWFLGMSLVLALLATVARGEQARENVRWGLIKNLQANYQACNEENMEHLLETMSEEMPNRELFQKVTREEWAAGDTYNKLEDVVVLEHSNAPNANCEYPYATAMVTQTVVQLRRGDEQALSVFRSRCEDGKCSPSDLAERMGLNTKTETTRLQMLFKHEGGEWKLVAGLTRPVACAPGPSKVEREDEQPEQADVQIGGGSSRRRSGRSVFN